MITHYRALNAALSYSEKGNEFTTLSMSRAWKQLETLIPAEGFPPSIKLFSQGEVPGDVFFIAKGLVKLTRVEQEGRELILDLRSAGWLLGSAAVIAQRPLTTTAVTLTPCSLLRMRRPLFHQMLKDDSAGLPEYLRTLHSLEICNQMERLVQLGLLSARRRLEDLLRRMIPVLDSSPKQTSLKLQLPLKNWEVAQLIAVTPPYLCQLFHELELEGILRRKKGWLIIPDITKLRHWSAS